MKEDKKQSSFFSDKPDEFYVGFIPTRSGTYRIEINDGIHSVSQFSSAILALEAAKEDDQIEIHLQCNGGNVDATDAFIHAMRGCAANIHIVATGGCHSAATHILLEGDSFELSDQFNACIHCGQDGAYGNVNEYRIKAKFDEKFRVQKFRDQYEGFLTESEIEDMLNGVDIWVDNKGWIERHQTRNAYVAKKIAEFQKSQKKSARKPKKTVDVEQEV